MREKISMNFVVVAPDYDENKGGSLVLHKLCHLLNQSGHSAFIFPYVSDTGKGFNQNVLMFKRWVKRHFITFKTNAAFNTPLIKCRYKIPSDSIVIYPEIVNGNPLRADNVVRWFLHNPGYHTGNIEYGDNEFYISYKSFGHEVDCSNSYFSKTELTITHFFDDVYYTKPDDTETQRRGSAYCLRKGAGRTLVHNLDDSILIDGMSHSQIADVFRKVKYFYCYDEYTAYFWFAIKCGCIPVVIPYEGKDKRKWYPKEVDRLGIAYGLDDIEFAISTKNQALDKFARQEQENMKSVSNFVSELRYFLNEIKNKRDA